MNNIILVGRLTKDPELKQVGEYTKAEFSIAVDRDYVDKSGQRGVDFIPIEVWGKRAEFCIKYLYKGIQVGINGRLSIDRYKNANGENRSFAKVKAESFKFLESGRSKRESKYFDSKTVFEVVEEYNEKEQEELPF